MACSFIEREPLHLFRLMVDLKFLIHIAENQKPNIIMIVSRNTLTLRDLMNIQVEDLTICQANIFQARLFAYFFQTNPPKLRVSIGMTTYLQPSVELGMVGKQAVGKFLVHHPGRSCKMGMEQASFKAIRIVI